MHSDFVGRQQEMGQMTTALDAVLSGQGHVVVLAGEPGIGKTRALEELAVHAEAVGVQVLWGRCPEECGAPLTGLGCKSPGPT
jgi:predicted ATP-dependent serine protease